MLPSLRDLDLTELEKLVTQCGERPFRAKQLAQWLYKNSALDFASMKNLPGPLTEKLSRAHAASTLSLVSKQVSSLNDRSIKYLFRTGDGYLIETVLILSPTRRTVCLSTQVGCKMGCRFCASGKEGLVRHLTAGEILDQIACVQKDQGSRATNLVYMGMGEPLDNYEALIKSLRTANAAWGYEIGQRHITVSTVGVVPGIRRLSAEGLNQIKLSWSLHSPDNEMRTRLIPSNRKYSLPDILKALREARPSFKRDITLEYILLEGATDRPEDAKGVIEIGRALNAKINLIPYNAIEDAEYERPSDASIRAFQKKLETAGLRTTVRYSAGQDINGACGQLRLQEKRKTRPASGPS